MTDRPLCKCHGVPMQKNGRERDGRQRYNCAVRRSAWSRDWYAKNRERRLAYFAERYRKNALPKLMRQHARYHQNRLVELQQAVTEGGRNG